MAPFWVDRSWHLCWTTSPLLAEDYLCIELAKLHRHKRAHMPAAEAVRRGESKWKRCTLSNSERVHLWQKNSESFGDGGPCAPPSIGCATVQNIAAICVARLWASGNNCNELPAMCWAFWSLCMVTAQTSTSSAVAAAAVQQTVLERSCFYPHCNLTNTGR